VCFIDLDYFKQINDTYGHDRGDTLILQMAQRLTQHIPSEHTLARVGGDEFVLLSNTNTIEELHQQLSELILLLSNPYHIDGMDVKVTASIGATLYPLDESDGTTLVSHADTAMYEAKEAGRNCYRIYAADTERKARIRHKKIDAVHHALMQNELRLYYQPKVNLRTGKVVGMEALIRWQHPTEGLLPPSAFLPTIENNDLMVSVGDWVVKQALTDMTIWKKQGFAFNVSINVSERQLQQPDFSERLISTFAHFPDIAPKQLQLELLENAILDAEHISPMLEQLKNDFGLSIALDDFGTGYSSLTYLKQLPVDTIKIDQSFIFNMLDNMEDLAIVEALVSIANIFHLDILAEGVESGDHCVILLRLGCDLVQGYGIARPMPSEDIESWINSYLPDPRWADWVDKSWNRDDFPLLIAQYDHIKWVKSVIHQVEEITNLNELKEPVDHNHCRFGNWYRTHGKKHYGHLPEYDQIETIHRYVHTLGAKMIKLKQDGKQEEAIALIPDLLDLKRRIVDKISALQLHS
jgi:diguanylate cyclase (GGDEF)-like protein